MFFESKQAKVNAQIYVYVYYSVNQEIPQQAVV